MTRFWTKIHLKVVVIFATLLCITLPGTALGYPITGATVYEPEELSSWAKEHADLDTSADAAAAAIEALYHQDGYLAAEVIPVTDADGNTVIHVYEGRLGAVYLGGGEAKAQAMVGRFIEPIADGMPLRIDRLERQMLLAGDQGGIDVTVALDHPDPTAGSVLNVSISQGRQGGSMSFDIVPQRPGSVGRLVAEQSGYSLLTGGDQLSALGVLAREVGGDIGFAGRALYRVPVGGRGVFAEFFAGTALADRELDTLQITNEQRGHQFGASIGFPIVRSMDRSIFIVGEIETIEGKSTFGGLRTKSGADVFRGYLIGSRSFVGGAQAEGSVRISAGKRRQPEPGVVADGSRHFGSIRVEAGMVSPIAKDLFLRLETEGQIALTDLPEVEHFFLGHLPLVRGYAQSEVEADTGAAATMQLEHPISLSADTAMTGFVFTDFGFVRRRDADPLFVRDQEIASIGAGMTASKSSGLSLTAWLALPLADARQTEAGDPIVYFRLAQKW